MHTCLATGAVPFSSTDTILAMSTTSTDSVASTPASGEHRSLFPDEFAAVRLLDRLLQLDRQVSKLLEEQRALRARKEMRGLPRPLRGRSWPSTDNPYTPEFEHDTKQAPLPEQVWGFHQALVQCGHDVYQMPSPDVSRTFERLTGKLMLLMPFAWSTHQSIRG